MSADDLYQRVYRKAKGGKEDSQEVVQGEKFVKLLEFEGSIMRLCFEGLQVIEKAQGAIGILALTGPAKTGRTSLLNLLIKRPDLNEPEFLESGTKGVWIYSLPVYKGEVEVFAIDTQGFGNAALDRNLMTLLYVMCSAYIFNSRGHIDESAMKKLGVIRELPKIIEKSGRNVELDLSKLAPRFIWSLRDFTLNLNDETGRPISGKDYLESVLDTGRVQSDYTNDFQESANLLQTLFVERDCVRFPRPTDDDVEEFDLRTGVTNKFQRQLDKLYSMAIAQCPSKKFYGQAANGSLLSSMMKIIVNELNSNNKIDFKKSWRMVKEAEYNKLLDEIKDNYSKSRDFDVEAMPYEENDLVLNLHRAKEQAVMSLRKAFVPDRMLENRLLEEFDSYFETDLKYTIEGNLQASIEYNTIILDKVFRGIFANMDNGYYTEHFEDIDKDWDVAAAEYEAQAKGPGRFQALNIFANRFQNGKLEDFFHRMLETYEDKLKATEEKSNLIKSKRRKAESELSKLNLEDKDLIIAIQEIEAKIGVENEELSPEKRLDIVIEWLKSSEARKRQLEEECRRAEAEQSRAMSPTKRPRQEAQKKSCCVVF
mmetsp:Transcript_26878/g.48446  ORF Transcript_26878/g.48446 Transcript_26878/m.48446 type:complete len:596 (-) Transcript_26878:31-1818(-)